MEECSTEEKEKADARDKVRVKLAQAAKVAQQIADDVDLSDTPPHLLGR